MARTKNKPNPTKPNAAQTPTPREPSGTRADQILSTLGAKWGHELTSVERTVFESKYSASQCEKKGAETRSEGVEREALAWVAQIDAGLAKFPAELRRYRPSRLAWFLECLGKLHDARAIQRTKGDSAAQAGVALTRAQTAALQARREVVASLTEIVEGDPHAEEALSSALGATTRPDHIVESIEKLCALARDWLGRKDNLSKARVATSGLTMAEVETAEKAGATLAAAATGKTLEGAAVVRDTPAVNQIEGRVLFEMRAAMRVFNAAHELNGAVPKLSPGPATRSALVSRNQPKEKGDPAAPPEKKDA